MTLVWTPVCFNFAVALDEEDQNNIYQYQAQINQHLALNTEFCVISLLYITRFPPCDLNLEDSK